MRLKKAIYVFLMLPLLSIAAFAQKAEITISLNENFFDALLDGVFASAPPPEFPIAQNLKSVDTPSMSNGFGANNPVAVCSETIKILREVDGVRSAVRFRDGQILAPLAFSGAYNPPFIGCVEFSGFAESVINIEFDQQNQRLIARVQVLKVSLSGTGGVGGTVIAKMVQSSIDKKINPLELIRMDKVSFLVPVQNSGNMQMKATAIRHQILNGTLNIQIEYQFMKA